MGERHGQWYDFTTPNGFCNFCRPPAKKTHVLKWQAAQDFGRPRQYTCSSCAISIVAYQGSTGSVVRAYRFRKDAR